MRRKSSIHATAYLFTFLSRPSLVHPAVDITFFYLSQTKNFIEGDNCQIIAQNTQQGAESCVEWVEKAISVGAI